MTTELDSYPVSQLSDRYSIGRSQVYSRLESLTIKPEKQGNKAYLNADQLSSMDTLHDHIIQGGAIADFTQGKLTKIPPSDKSTRQTGQTTELTMSTGNLTQSTGQLDINALAAIIQAIAPVAPVNEFEFLEILDKASDRAWYLSSSQLRSLLSASNLPKSPFKRYGFQFVATGKNGNETAWKISKI